MFPNDFRNGHRWFQYDPTKWLILLCQKMCLAKNLKKTPRSEVLRVADYTANLKLTDKTDEFTIVPTVEPLEYITNLQERVDRGTDLVVIDDLVYDVSDYMDKHPGGKAILKAYVGRDASYAFNGGLNKHSISAKLLAQSMIVGKRPK